MTNVNNYIPKSNELYHRIKWLRQNYILYSNKLHQISISHSYWLTRSETPLSNFIFPKIPFRIIP